MSAFDKTIVLRAFNNYDSDAVSASLATEFNDESLAVQSEYEDTDINVIVARYGLTGTLPAGGLNVPQYGDFTSEVHDYQSALNLLLHADEGFMELPANIRARFDNSPAKLLDFLNNPDNIGEARELGLVPPDEAPVEGDASAETETGV